MSTYVCLNPYSNGIYNLTTVAGVQLKQGALRLNPYSNGIYNLTVATTTETTQQTTAS